MTEKSHDARCGILLELEIAKHASAKTATVKKRVVRDLDTPFIAADIEIIHDPNRKQQDGPQKLCRKSKGANQPSGLSNPNLARAVHRRTDRMCSAQSFEQSEATKRSWSMP